MAAFTEYSLKDCGTTKELSWPEIRANSFSIYLMTLLFCESVYGVKFRNSHSLPNVS